MAKITVKDTEIVFYKKEQEDYISLTDIAKVRNKENPSQINGVSQSERLIKLNQIAIQQMSVLMEVENRKLLK